MKSKLLILLLSLAISQGLFGQITLHDAIRLRAFSLLGSQDSFSYTTVGALRSYFGALSGTGDATSLAVWSSSTGLTYSPNLTFTSGVLEVSGTSENNVAVIGDFTIYKSDVSPSILTKAGAGVGFAGAAIGRSGWDGMLLAIGGYPRLWLVAHETSDTSYLQFITSRRPPTAAILDTGAMYAGIDGKPWWWTGSEWVDLSATGSSPPSTISPAQITSDQDDYNPAGWSTASICRLSGDNGIRAITSFSARADGTEVKLINVGTYPLYIPGEHPDGTAANRVKSPKDFVLPPGETAVIVYDGTDSRWRIFAMFSEQDAYSVNGQYHYYSAGTSTAGDNNIIGTAGSSESGPGNATSSNRITGHTGTSASGAGAVYMVKTEESYGRIGTAHIMSEWNTSVSVLSDGTDTYQAEWVITTSPNTAVVASNNSIGVRYSHSLNSGKFLIFSRDNAGDETTLDSGVTVSAAINHNIRVELNLQGTEARVYIDGAFRGRLTSNLPPANNIGARAAIVKSLGTTKRSVQVMNQKVGALYPF